MSDEQRPAAIIEFVFLGDDGVDVIEVPVMGIRIEEVPHE